MGLINIASGNSIWRGLDYYKDNKVNSYKLHLPTEQELIEAIEEEKKNFELNE